MSQPLKVNTDEVRGVGAAFTAAADKLAAVQADAPLGAAAAAIPQLQTAGACNAAKAAVAKEMSAIATGARTYGSNLNGAATRYESTDQSSGQNIAGVQIPPPAS